MKPDELFEEIKRTQYIKTGDSVDYAVKVYDDEKRIRLLFQESDGNADWRNNLDFPIKPYKNQENTLWFAKGWALAYKSANEEIMYKVINAINYHPDYDVEVCGWSYGGAIALLAVEDLHYRTGIKSIVTTFGGPKPLFGKKTKDYVLSCCKEVNQYCHKNDIVPTLPPFIGYEMAKKVSVGKWKPFGKLNPWKWHTIYGDETLYDEL